jgi:hypothetical protein
MTYRQHTKTLTAEDGLFEQDASTLEYISSLQELSEAGLGDGFSIRHIDEMPEHESEFVPTSDGRAVTLEEDLCGYARERMPRGMSTRARTMRSGTIE